MSVTAIATIPPYATFIKDVARHQIVSGMRLNVVMPIKESVEDVVKRLLDVSSKYNKNLWIDLKGRQLRVKNYGVPPFTEIELSHNIKVKTPVTAYFSNGEESATVLEIANGNKLIMEAGPRRVVGPGESVNIPDSSLEIEGFLTDVDKKYLDVGMKLGFHNYMLSFVESEKDIIDFMKLDPAANLVAKIESRSGMNYVANDFKKKDKLSLMAARGDMFVELAKPHHIIDALETIVKKDPEAIAASRIFASLSRGLEPSCEDIGDADNLMRMGYKTLMLGDDICQKRESIISGLNLLYEMSRKYN